MQGKCPALSLLLREDSVDGDSDAPYTLHSYRSTATRPFCSNFHFPLPKSRQQLRDTSSVSPVAVRSALSFSINTEDRQNQRFPESAAAAAAAAAPEIPKIVPTHHRRRRGRCHQSCLLRAVIATHSLSSLWLLPV